MILVFSFRRRAYRPYLPYFEGRRVGEWGTAGDEEGEGVDVGKGCMCDGGKGVKIVQITRHVLCYLRTTGFYLSHRVNNTKQRNKLKSIE